MANIELAEAIQKLRQELSASVKNAENSDIQFQLGPIELELQVVATKEASADAGVKWMLFNASAQAQASSERTQTLKLTLNPVDKDGNSILVSNPSATRPD